MIKTILKIDGMMCGMCEAHINEVIRKTIQDASKVKSSHTKGECTFFCENKPDRNLLEKAIKETGYELKDLSFEPYEKKKWGIF